MSQAPSATKGPAKKDRHQLIAQGALWQRSETAVIYSGGVLLIGGVVTYFDSRKLVLGLIVVGVLMMAVGLGLHFVARRCYVYLAPQGLAIHGVCRERLVPAEAVRQARVQTLQVLFSAPSRRQLLPRSLRRFQETPALVLRLDLPEERLRELSRAVGRGSLVDQDLILLVTEAAALERALQPHLRRRPPAPAGHRR